MKRLRHPVGSGGGKRRETDGVERTRRRTGEGGASRMGDGEAGGGSIAGGGREMPAEAEERVVATNARE